MSSPTVLVLYWHPDGIGMRTAVEQHLRAVESAASGPRVVYVNTFEGAPRLLRRVRPGAIVLHNTFLCMRWSHLFASWKWGLRWLAVADCPKIAMPQDEYDHAYVLDDWLDELGPELIVTNFGEDVRRTLYPLNADRTSYVHGFTGYIDEEAAAGLAPSLRPHAERPLDLVYRASHLPFWFGSQGQLKHLVGSVVADAARGTGLSTDVSTSLEDTIVGDAWLPFLASGRVVLGCESGSSVLDRRGEVRAAIQSMLLAEPELTFDEVSARLPAGWDDYRFFAISPRHFEAVITKTCQVLVEGHYDGVFEAGRHYIALRRDFANLDDVLEQIRDSRLTQEIADRAYEEIYCSGRYTYRDLAAKLEPSFSRGGGDATWAAARVVAGARPLRRLGHVKGVTARARPYAAAARRRARSYAKAVRG
jgi:hypothetical protein